MNPTIDLTPKRVICSLHGEPFRRGWPKGYGIFSIKLFDAFCKSTDPEIIRQLGGDKSGIETLLDERPLCCRSLKSELVPIYIESGVGDLAYCVMCGLRKMGTPITLNVSKDGKSFKERTYKHVCFECVCDLRREAKEIP